MPRLTKRRELTGQPQSPVQQLEAGGFAGRNQHTGKGDEVEEFDQEFVMEENAFAHLLKATVMENSVQYLQTT